MARPFAWKIAKVAAFLLGITPLAWLVWAIFNDGLGANPVDAFRDVTGDWILRFLLITLSISPLRQITGWNGAIRFRRMAGLFAFFYAFVHFFTYLWLDQQFDLNGIVADIVKRPWITVGVLSFTLMVPLAITSTKKWIARLGGKRWQLLHRLVYVSAAAGVLHYFLLVKLDETRPLRYAAGFAVLLAFRLWKVFPNFPSRGTLKENENLRSGAGASAARRGPGRTKAGTETL